MDYNKVAKEVIEAVGKDNLVAAAHCATRPTFGIERR